MNEIKLSPAISMSHVELKTTFGTMLIWYNVLLFSLQGCHIEAAF